MVFNLTENWQEFDIPAGTQSVVQNKSADKYVALRVSATAPSNDVIRTRDYFALKPGDDTFLGNQSAPIKVFARSVSGDPVTIFVDI